MSNAVVWPIPTPSHLCQSFLPPAKVIQPPRVVKRVSLRRQGQAELLEYRGLQLPSADPGYGPVNTAAHLVASNPHPAPLGDQGHHRTEGVCLVGLFLRRNDAGIGRSGPAAGRPLVPLPALALIIPVFIAGAELASVRRCGAAGLWLIPLQRRHPALRLLQAARLAVRQFPHPGVLRLQRSHPPLQRLAVSLPSNTVSYLRRNVPLPVVSGGGIREVQQRLSHPPGHLPESQHNASVR